MHTHMLCIMLLWVCLLKTFSPSVDDRGAVNGWLICMTMFTYLCFRELWVCELHCGDSKLTGEKSKIPRCLQWADIQTRTTTSSAAAHRMSLKEKYMCIMTICENIHQSTMLLSIQQNNSIRHSTMILTDKYSNDMWGMHLSRELLIIFSHYERHVERWIWKVNIENVSCGMRVESV